MMRRLEFRFLLANLLHCTWTENKSYTSGSQVQEQERGARFYIWCRGLHHKYKDLASRETFYVDDYNITIALFDYAFGWMWLFVQTC